MSPMETCLGSIVGLIIINPVNIGFYIPVLAAAIVGYLYMEE